MIIGPIVLFLWFVELTLQLLALLLAALIVASRVIYVTVQQHRARRAQAG